MKVNFTKLNNNAVVPQYAKPGDAGLDLVAISKVEHGDLIEYGTGIAVEIPEGFVGLLFPRSSIKNYEISLTNHVGVIDSGYRGEIKAFFRKHKTPIGNIMPFCKHYEVLDKIAQLVVIPYPQIELQEVSELSITERGTGGFGSTGV